MQRKGRTDEYGRPLLEPEIVIERTSPWKAIPFIIIVAAVLGYALWAGRVELFAAYFGAKAYIVTSMTGKVSAVATVSPTKAVPSQGQALVKSSTGNELPLPTNKAVLPNRKDVKDTEKKGSGQRITTVKLANNSTLDIIDEPIPADCYAEQHADYDGYAVQWGLGHKAKSAAECCKRCKKFKGNGKQWCNIWVWCGDPSGKCWTMDIHEHTTGDCWLKFQETWDNNPDLKMSNLKINHVHKFSDAFRQEHKTAPEMVPWVAGVIPAQKGSKPSL